MEIPGQAPDADERTRTSTGSPPHGPEPCASTNSATSARTGIVAPPSRTSRPPRLPFAAVKRVRLDVASPASAGYLRFLARRQQAVERRIERAVPAARVVRRYRIVL